MGLFSRSERRRNTDERREDLQYWTPRGAIPTKVVDRQVGEVGDLRQPQVNLYPRVYRNEEKGTQMFEDYERRNDPDLWYREVPVASRMNLNRPGAKLTQIESETRPHHNDRARIARKERNDPGPFRAVVPTNEETGYTLGVAGVLYHPEGNSRGFQRAPVMPLDRHGRQLLHRFEDDGARGHRVDTWPPRDENAEELAIYEARYQKVRKPSRKKEPKKEGYKK